MGNKKPNQNWDDLRYFLTVARTGTVSAAAKQLGTEHTTVARHVQALEDELNSRLFHKSNSGYGLTDAGERLLTATEAIESAYVFAKAAASSEGQPIIGTVRVGAPDGFGSVFLAPRVRAVRRLDTTRICSGFEWAMAISTSRFNRLNGLAVVKISISSLGCRSVSVGKTRYARNIPLGRPGWRSCIGPSEAATDSRIEFSTLHRIEQGSYWRSHGRGVVRCSRPLWRKRTRSRSLGPQQ